ncbi:MAG: endonuclease III [Thermodesulfovibrionia bacterium]|nr:endonuclease III [Thermodesulfovibrionia bacterium]
MADAKKIARLLIKKYPDPQPSLDFSTPLELLIATILSAQCTDKRVNEVIVPLFRKYRSASDYAAADLKTFEQEIRPTGFYRNKAKMIINCCKKIIEEFNSRVPGTMEQLITLPGVGRKTANVVLGSAFGKQTIAVDTHVLRVSNRLGIAHSNDPEKVEYELVAQFPNKKLTALNLALIFHGRETCKARRPACAECVLFDECEWKEKVS